MLDVIDLKICRFSPVFHEWFLETFPEPSTWLASRLVYTRSAAVMSMIGFILGYEATDYSTVTIINFTL
jgi:phosphatidylinositol kinase/protein kinase (PI-3  family)